MDKGICSGCGGEKYIQNKTKNFCVDCIYKRSHGGKTQLEVQYEKERQKLCDRSRLSSRSESNSGNKTGKSRRPSRNSWSKVKVTGEKEMFFEIWSERPHVCTNPDCRKFLGDEPRTYFFSHIKPKSTHSELRLEKSNIRLLCFDCHFGCDHQGKKIRDEENS